MRKKLGIVSMLLFCVGVFAFFYQYRCSILYDFFYYNTKVGQWRAMVFVEIIPSSVIFIALFFFGKFKIVNLILKFSVIALMIAGLISNILYCIDIGASIENIKSAILEDFLNCYILPMFLFMLSAITTIFGKTRKTLLLF